MLNFVDFYILYPGHPRYNSSELIEDEAAKVIVQKYEMVLFTITGDVFGAPRLGANLIELLHETSYDAETVKNEIIAQIDEFIPELGKLEYTIEVNFYEHPDRFEEYMVIDFYFNGINVYAVIE